jgi:hypothetical protein
MRKQRDQERAASTTLHLWNYAAALKAVPYLRAVVRSLREHWLDEHRALRLIQLLDARPGRPDRQTLIRRAEAVRDIERATGELEETLDELKAIDVYCLDPVQGLALIPFGQGDELAWFVFDLFAPQGVEAWQFDGDPPQTRRPLEQNPEAVLSAEETSLKG